MTHHSTLLNRELFDRPYFLIALFILGLSLLEVIPVVGKTFPANRLKVSVPDTIVTENSDTGTLPVELQLEDGWHINTDDPIQEYLIPTRLALDSPPILRTVRYPSGERYSLSFSREQLMVYTGKATIRATLDFSGDLNKISGSHAFGLQYQPCSDRQCLRPKQLKIPFVITRTSQSPPGKVVLDFRSDPGDGVNRDGSSTQKSRSEQS